MCSSTEDPPSQFIKKHYPNISMDEWSNWHWQLKNSITDVKTLKKFILISQDEEEFIEHAKLPLRITPYYLSLIDPNNMNDPLRKTVVPSSLELVRSEGEDEDPLGEHSQEVVPGLVHRYPDRVLFLATNFCSFTCRYCVRSREVCQNTKTYPLEPRIEYIRNHPEIRDVLLSGGDPLTLPTDVLEQYIAAIRAIPHVEIVRIGTKVPMVLPQRIDDELCTMLKKYHPLFISIHATLPVEITEETKAACMKLACVGIPLRSQTVLLKGVNDNVETMKKLMQKLLTALISPYYIYQCDPIAGSSHFRTSVRKGIEIMEGLRGHTSGYCVPQFIVDLPGGGGKVPVFPQYLLSEDGDEIVFRNYLGEKYYLHNEENVECPTECLNSEEKTLQYV